MQREEEPRAGDATNWFARGRALALDSGEVKTHHELLVLLNRIYSARLTGILQLVLGRVERQLFFNGGQLVFASSSDRFDSLGEMMIREGAITQAQFGEASELIPLEELAADADLRVMPSQDPLLRYQAVELNENERKLLACVTQVVSAEELLAQSGLPGEQVRENFHAWRASSIPTATWAVAMCWICCKI